MYFLPDRKIFSNQLKSSRPKLTCIPSQLSYSPSLSRYFSLARDTNFDAAFCFP